MLVGHKKVDEAGSKRRVATVRWNHGSKDGLGERGQQGKDRVRFRPSLSPSFLPLRDVFRPRRSLAQEEEGRERREKDKEGGTINLSSEARQGRGQRGHNDEKVFGHVRTRAVSSVIQRYFPPS